MENPKFQIFKGKDEQFYFRLQAGNGEIILQSEAYTAKASAQNGIESVKENALLDERYQRKIAKNNQCYFNLEAANGEIIGVSETYPTEQAREKGIAAVKDDASGAPIEDIA